MSTNYVNVMPILGVNLEGNEDASSIVGDGAPRLDLLTPTLISGNRAAIYVVTSGVVNPTSTVTVDAAGTAVATTATGGYVSLNTSTTSTGQYIWVRDNTALVV